MIFPRLSIVKLIPDMIVGVSGFTEVVRPFVRALVCRYMRLIVQTNHMSRDLYVRPLALEDFFPSRVVAYSLHVRTI